MVLHQAREAVCAMQCGSSPGEQQEVVDEAQFKRQGAGQGDSDSLELQEG